MDVLNEIESLPPDWHDHGSLSPEVLRRLAGLLDRGVRRSVETGTGKSTLLLSNLSANHTVFTLDDEGRGSLAAVRRSVLLQPNSVEFVLGPTQRTLPAYTFGVPVDCALIDGPHAYPFPELEYYFIYPHLAAGALLVIDDIHIPTIARLFEFLREDPMFEVVCVVRTTAFLRRTLAPTFDPLGDSWSEQPFNSKRHPDFSNTTGFSLIEKLKARVPPRIRRAVRERVGR